MNLEECYLKLGGDYAGVVGRLRSERLVQKFLLKFPQDGSYRLLLKSVGEGNAAEAFRAAHTIKGMCQNLGFTALEKSSSALTEALRGGSLAECGKYLPAVRADYERTAGAIAEFEKSLQG